MCDKSQNEKDDALWIIRSEQAAARKSLGNPELDPERVRQEALSRGRHREECSTPRSPDKVHSLGFTYPAASEALRRQRTREIIERAEPGADENPVYLERLARQAASVEMTILNRDEAESLNRILLATTMAPYHIAKSRPVGEFQAVFLADGLLNLYYQAAAAVRRSWKVEPEKAAKSGSVETFSDDLKVIESNLMKDSASVEQLYRVLKSFLFDGFPKGQQIEGEEQWPVAFRVILALPERFTVAHEYGHSLLHYGRPAVQKSPNMVSHESDKWDAELEADTFATYKTILSAEELDRVAPNMAMQGPLFALKATELVRKALSLVTMGEVTEDEGSPTHPPISVRIKHVEQVFKKLAREQGWASERLIYCLAPSRLPSQTLDLLWERIEKHFKCHAGANLHQIWKPHVLSALGLKAN